jgi:hypothetical protein
METVKGSWSGRLVDAGGFEGTVNLSLREGRGAVEGVFDAAIDGQHRPTHMRGMVSGSLKGAQLVLTLDTGDKDAPVSVSFAGAVFATRSGELGACGRYAVSARRFSPLLGGVISIRLASSEKRVDNLLTRSAVATVLGKTAEPAAKRPRARRKK